MRPIRPKILLVDDEVFLTRAMKLLLERENRFEVETLNDPRKALEKAMAWLPDLVVLDIIMPGLNGVELARRIKAESLTRHIPIVFYSSCPKGPEGFRFVSKPASSEELVCAIIEELDACTV